MAEASIRARIAADASGFHAALKSTEDAAKAWGIRMARTTAQAAGGGGKGMAILELSRAIEDAQYGIRGVLNNIPGLVMALGGSAGLAGAASVAAVAAFQLGRQLRAMWEAEKVAKEESAELNEEIAKQTDLIRERDAQAAKKGSVEGAKRLHESIEQANEEAAKSNQILASNTKLTKEADDATTALAKAKVEASSESSKATQLLEIERAAMVQAQAEEERRLDRSLEILDTRRAAAEKFADEEAARAAKAAQYLAGVLPTGNTGVIMSARNAAEAAAVDAARAEQEYRDQYREGATEREVLNAQLKAKEVTDIQKTTALELAGMAKVKEARAKEAAEQLEIEQKQFDKIIQLQAAYDKEAATLAKITREHKEALGHIEQEARIKGLRETGRGTQADREERAMRTQDRMAQIIQDTGASPAHAADLATQLEGGRGRINARSRRQRQAGGIDEITEAPRGSSGDRRTERILEKIEKHLSGKRDDKGDPVRREH